MTSLNFSTKFGRKFLSELFDVHIRHVMSLVHWRLHSTGELRIEFVDILAATFDNYAVWK